LDDGYLLKDVDGEPQSPRFIEHRHDQSCLTAVAAKYGIRGFHDETWYPVSPIKAFLTNTSDKPILALRNKDGVSFLPLIRFLSWFLKLKRD
ncbi:MAG: hypothetical protein P8Q23_02285, partial [Paracoccaceae bacterium]|nr:hypothetical protein [Paracoccaceae bacterium]